MFPAGISPIKKICILDGGIFTCLNNFISPKDKQDILPGVNDPRLYIEISPMNIFSDVSWGITGSGIMSGLSGTSALNGPARRWYR